jgi:predicted 2-oxoglutarate/Fe(II)-dependent dioxygenase YbiX
MKKTGYGAGVFTIDNFLSPEECINYIQMSETIGYEKAEIITDEGSQIRKEIRNNDRVIFDDEKLATFIFERAKAFLPEDFEDWALIGLNERFRFYRYTHGQFFKWHRDGYFRRNDKEMSDLTFLMYLNDDYQGGETSFNWETIKPKTGMALIFPHRLTHQGSPVESGVKYVLRTDVMYRKIFSSY